MIDIEFPIPDENCERCGKGKSKWEINKTYEGLDVHHNPPEYMFEDRNKWFGEMRTLCRECHKELHTKINDILKEYSIRSKKYKSEYWNWKFVIGDNRIVARDQVRLFTRSWIKNEY